MTQPTMLQSLLNGEELDLTKGEGHKHPDLNSTDNFLCLIGERWFFGTFSELWYGWSFNGWLNRTGLQYDTPGTNASCWKRIIRVAIRDKKDDSPEFPVPGIDLAAGGLPPEIDASPAEAALTSPSDQIATLTHCLEESRTLHVAGMREAYRLLGIEDDGEYRWKWLLLELSKVTTCTAAAAIDVKAIVDGLNINRAESNTVKARLLESLIKFGKAVSDDALVQAATAVMPAAHPFKPPEEWRKFYVEAFYVEADSDRGVDPDADADRCSYEFWQMVLNDADRAERLSKPTMGRGDGERDARNLNEA